jgi:hypothetical protein
MGEDIIAPVFSTFDTFFSPHFGFPAILLHYNLKFKSRMHIFSVFYF